MTQKGLPWKITECRCTLEYLQELRWIKYIASLFDAEMTVSIEKSAIHADTSMTGYIPI